MTSCPREARVHILFQGDQRATSDPNEIDEYVHEFRRADLMAVRIPLLRFEFKNLDKLSQLLMEKLTTLARTPNSTHLGLVLTSPRVVEALFMSIQLSNVKNELLHLINNIESNHIFVVGEKTGRLLESKLNLKYNLSSAVCGNGQSLADYILLYAKQHLPLMSSFNLIIPKSSLANNSIDETLSKNPLIQLNSMVVYETMPSNEIKSDELQKLHLPRDLQTIVINFIFFSPSGVAIFNDLAKQSFKSTLSSLWPQAQLTYRYSSIGKTTQQALINSDMDVYRVASKPTPIGLLDSLLQNKN